MASVISTVLTEVATIAVEVSIDKAELTAGALVKAGQVGSINGEPIYVYLSTNASAS